MTRLILILTMLFTTAVGYSQYTSEQKDNRKKEHEYHHGIGAAAGFTTGYGLAYMYHIKRFTGQVNFAPIKNETKASYNAGLTLMLDFIDGGYFDLFGYFANSYWYDSEEIEVYNPNTNLTETQKNENSYWNHGIGVGVEVNLEERAGWNFMVGYGAQEDFDIINLTGETSLFVKF